MDKKIVKLNGGLGNQMFQYAFAYALAQKTKAKILFDFSYFSETSADENVVIRPFELKHFKTSCEEATEEDLSTVIQSEHRRKIQRFLWKYFKIRKFKPSGNNYQETVPYSFDKNLFSDEYYYYDGYYQNEAYFKNYRKEIIKHFELGSELDEQNKSILDLIGQTNSVSLHVRRGDYVTLESANKHHGTCSIEYYEKAIKLMAKKVKTPHFFLFSDDMDWVLKNLKIDYPFTVVNINQNRGWYDINLMKHCKHNICANSSFSWWGAWLNENQKKNVIAPICWIKKSKKNAIIPKNWIKL